MKETAGKKFGWTRQDTMELLKDVFFIIGSTCLSVSLIITLKSNVDKSRNNAELDELRERVQIAAQQAAEEEASAKEAEPTPTPEFLGAVVEEIPVPEILPEYRDLYTENPDMVGWLHVDDTKIDYPVMQTVEDPWYYLHKSFKKVENNNGSLFADAECVIGDGTAEYDYRDGSHAGANILIYGHRMNNGDMFGNLGRYQKQEYADAHSVIYFDTLYEHRRYEVISVFTSQIYRSDQDVFKFYQFFVADSKEEFEDFYKNIKELSVYDTDVEAEYGDEFLTLSTCDYWTQNGRLVVVAKRVE